MKKILIVCGLLIIGGAIRWAAKQYPGLLPIGPSTDEKPSVGMPNPASVYCQERGGALEIVTDASGGQAGWCRLPNGIICDEWAYFRGECGLGSGESRSYTSPLGFSLSLPGACTITSSIQGGNTPQYDTLKDLTISNPNGDLQIQCFLPSLQEPKEIVHFALHTYPCDAQGTPVTIGDYTFVLTETLPGLGADQGKRCYKIPLKNNNLFITFLEKTYARQILGSLKIQ